MAVTLLVISIIIAIILIFVGVGLMSQGDREAIVLIVIAIAPLLIGGVAVYGMDYKSSEPSIVDKSEISTMCDDEVCIIRINDEFQKTYDTKKEYDAISCDNYEVEVIEHFDMTGSLNDRTYELILNK